MIGFVALMRSLHVIYPFSFCPSPTTQEVLFKIGIMDQINLRCISTATTGTIPKDDTVLKEEI